MIKQTYLFYSLASKIPSLERNLKISRINKKPADYLKESLKAAFIVSLTVSLLIFIITTTLGTHWIIAALFFITFFLFTGYYFINRPLFGTIKAQQHIESEIVSAVRFLKIELKSERSLYGALINTSKNFPVIGIYLDEIIDKVKMGKTLEQALNEAVEDCPSSYLRNLYWQLLNSLQTGADITTSLQVQLEDIIEGQKIKIEEYGRELNALSLFYMMVSIIIPTVGFTIVTAALTFIGYTITIGTLITIWLTLSAVQYFFMMLAEHRRPAVEAY